MVVQSNACNSGYVQGTVLKFCRVLTWNCCRWTGWERSRWELRKGLEIPDCRAGFRPPRKQKARRRRPLGKKENYQLKRTLCRLTVRGRGCWATELWLNLGRVGLTYFVAGQQQTNYQSVVDFIDGNQWAARVLKWLQFSPNVERASPQQKCRETDNLKDALSLAVEIFMSFDWLWLLV